LWLARLVEDDLAARRCVVSAGPRALDHEAVWPNALVAREVLRENVGRNDREELRTLEGWQGDAKQLERVERHGVGPRFRALDVYGKVHGGVRRELVEETRGLAGEARAHEHVINAGEHGAIGRRGGGHLHLFEVVDPHEARVALLGEPHLDEVA
jgi:hypothetical protein